MRRLVVISILLTLGGLALLLPSSQLVSLITSSSATTTATSAGLGGVAVFSGAASRGSTTDTTATIESLLGFGLIGVGVVLEFLSLFTDVGGAMPTVTAVLAEKEGAIPSGNVPAIPSGNVPPAEKKGTKQP